MNPFDWRTVLFAKHAQHVALVHFPIALIFIRVLFDLIALRKQNLVLLRAAYYTVVAAGVAAVPTIATGLMAWHLQFGGKAPRGNLKLHIFLALASSTLIWLVCWLHSREQRETRPFAPGIRQAIELAAVAITLLTGHVGGFVSGVNGPG